MPLSTYALTLLQPYDYSPVLSSQDFPTVQYYPGIASLLTPIIAWLTTVQPLIESAAQSASFPSSLSFGSIQNLITQGLALAAQLDVLTPAPVLFCAEFWDVIESLQQLTLFPELMQS